MAKEHMKRSSTSLIIREMQIRNANEVSLHLSEWPLSKNLYTINLGRRWRKGNLPILLVVM